MLRVDDAAKECFLFSGPYQVPLDRGCVVDMRCPDMPLVRKVPAEEQVPDIPLPTVTTLHVNVIKVLTCSRVRGNSSNLPPCYLSPICPTISASAARPSCGCLLKYQCLRKANRISGQDFGEDDVSEEDVSVVVYKADSELRSGAGATALADWKLATTAPLRRA